MISDCGLRSIILKSKAVEQFPGDQKVDGWYGSGYGSLNEVVVSWWSQSSRLLDGLSMWTLKWHMMAGNAGEADTGSQVPKSSINKGGND